MDSSLSSATDELPGLGEHPQASAEYSVGIIMLGSYTWQELTLGRQAQELKHAGLQHKTNRMLPAGPGRLLPGSPHLVPASLEPPFPGAGRGSAAAHTVFTALPVKLLALDL